ncbi:hypothetical protein BT63DRAFT_289882 [Microthyrium microscopicum]|uniref:Uncharacterized protein n=1 Tax=Microthyrium microscopicum TaxID=703497 RepID=A0A6A6U7B1_9PEZI|nr:hypothetical protein BT63DRAFT_289882 [Microthyrium microscopicum]
MLKASLHLEANTSRLFSTTATTHSTSLTNISLLTVHIYSQSSHPHPWLHPAPPSISPPVRLQTSKHIFAPLSSHPLIHPAYSAMLGQTMIPSALRTLTPVAVGPFDRFDSCQIPLSDHS